MASYTAIGPHDLNQLSAAARSELEHGGRMLIDGEFVDAPSKLPVIDPSSGKAISEICDASPADVDAAVGAARRAFESGPWRNTPPAEREKLLWRLAESIEEHADLLSELESVDVGMPRWMSRNLDVAGTAGVVRYMAGWPTKIGGRTTDVTVPIPGSEFVGFTTKEPVGVIGAIIPWNVPLMLAVWKLAPALAAGCTIVLKPSEDACLSVLALARLVMQVGIPPGVVNVVTGGASAGEALVSHPDIDKITFTGSTATGRRIAEVAARKSKKLTLELGGKSPQLLFADADFEAAIKGIGDAIFLNSGQVCVAGSRLYVERRRYEETVERLAQHAKSLAMGPALSDATVIGPLVSRRQQDRVLSAVKKAAEQGAVIATGSPEVESPGFHVRPTIVAGTRNSMDVVREEIFGPILSVAAFDDVDEAIALANDTEYGLSACIWTSNLSTAHRVARRIRSGKVAVNTEPLPYPALPEGGRKASGYGRDLGQESIESFLEVKSILIRTA
ncbi:aldehyde dehydrogenase [Bradyrhizobium sp. sBnM-33]|uniref:aldehyde dehydrogenase family protein n=1 Tax=Bradyrhizobium sp. sBnM-33 TaxID=2831780 RepID=UPI001BD0DB0E|nr:aldehyde dehydrogenase family protein [Bradyrhizobium sp. sBnM-33]WOH53386.1 aldehyde dehydrogenase family protein [Bradyrhizobium sp. sBnM-33]